MSKPEVSIIVTTWNSLEMFKLFWEYLKRYTKTPFELIVVDNGSTDGTVEFLKNINVKTILNKKNVGVVKALDLAEKLVKTKYLVSMNDDILVSPGWLEDLIDIYESDSKIKLISPIKPGTKVKYPDTNKSTREVWDEIKASVSDAKTMVAEFCKGSSYEELVAEIKKVNGMENEYLNCPPDFVAGCCILAETIFMKEIGGFSDTRFDLYGAEDVDRSWRVGEAGYSVVKTSKVFVHHFEGFSVKQNSLNTKRLLKKNNQRLVKKWGVKFWKNIRQLVEELGSVDAVVKKYWIVGWLIESISTQQIPLSMRDDVDKFLSSYNKNLS